jgi:hypothetical protein
MDWHKAPATAVLRQVLFRTPQGWTYWFFSAVNVVAGFLVLAYPAIAGWGPFQRGDGSFFFVWPLLYLLVLIGVSRFDDFEPSGVSVAFMVFGGLFPFWAPYTAPYWCRLTERC